MKCAYPKLGDGTVDFCLNICSKYDRKSANSCYMIPQRLVSLNFLLCSELMQKKTRKYWIRQIAQVRFVHAVFIYFIEMQHLMPHEVFFSYAFLVFLVNIFYSEIKCPEVRSNATLVSTLEFSKSMQSLKISKNSHVLQFTLIKIF